MQYGKIILVALGCAALGGCAMPAHSNALIFATNTTIALDVSASPTAGAPNITLGYKRQEAAWVPLLANQGSSSPDNDDRKSFDCSKPGVKPDKTPDPNADYSGCVFKGTGGNSDSDAYSVFASLNGGVESTTDVAKGVTINAKIGQYFATGLAARYLAQSGGAQLVNPAASPPTELKEVADAKSALVKSQAANLAVVTQFLGDGTYTTQRDALLKALGLPDEDYNQQQLKGADLPTFLAYISKEDALTADLAKAVAKAKGVAG